MGADAVNCPCGGATYAACCGRFHAGPLQLQAPNAEALMRSRYSAYVLRLGDYLLATWHKTWPCPRKTYSIADAKNAFKEHER